MPDTPAAEAEPEACAVEYDADGKYLRSVRINRNNSWSAK